MKVSEYDILFYYRETVIEKWQEGKCGYIEQLM